MRYGNQRDVESLDKLVDEIGLAEVIHALDAVCGEKAEHLRTNWQDERLARQWDKASALLCRLSARATIKWLSK